MKWPGRESDNSPPSSAKVKNDWKYSATYIFMACAHAALLVVYRVRENIFFSLFFLLPMENLTIPLADVIFKVCKRFCCHTCEIYSPMYIFFSRVCIIIIIIIIIINVKVKVMQSRYRPGVVQRVPGS